MARSIKCNSIITFLHPLIMEILTITTAGTYNFLQKSRHTQKITKEVINSNRWKFILALGNGSDWSYRVDSEYLDTLYSAIVDQVATAEQVEEFCNEVFDDYEHVIRFYK